MSYNYTLTKNGRVRYGDKLILPYIIGIDNSSYACGDLLCISILHEDTRNYKLLELYCYRYILHIVLDSKLYLLCKTHWVNLDYYIVLIEGNAITKHINVKETDIESLEIMMKNALQYGH